MFRLVWACAVCICILDRISHYSAPCPTKENCKEDIQYCRHSSWENMLVPISELQKQDEPVHQCAYMPYLTLLDKISQNSAYLKAYSQKNFKISQNFYINLEEIL